MLEVLSGCAKTVGRSSKGYRTIGRSLRNKTCSNLSFNQTHSYYNLSTKNTVIKIYLLAQTEAVRSCLQPKSILKAAEEEHQSRWIMTDLIVDELSVIFNPVFKDDGTPIHLKKINPVQTFFIKGMIFLWLQC